MNASRLRCRILEAMAFGKTLWKKAVDRDLVFPVVTTLLTLVLIAELIVPPAPDVPAAPTSTPKPPSTSTATSTITPRPTITTFFTATLPVEIAMNAYFNALPYPIRRQASEWTMSDDGVRYVSFWEGFVGSLYDDGGQPGVGNCTIGYGHLLHLGPCTGGESPSSISQTAALALLKRDLNNCGTYVGKYVTIPITQTQYNIMTGLVCGWGYEKFAKSEFLTLLNGGDFYGAAERLKTTAVYGIGIGLCPGLVRRRKVETRMFLQSPLIPMWPFVE